MSQPEIMEATESQRAWAEAFSAAQTEFPPIGKGKSATIETRGGGSYSYSYADLPTIIELVTPVLQKHGLSVGQSAVSLESGQIGVETRVYHTAGHVETFGPLFLPGGNDARSAGSAVTYARRYSLCAALGIAPDDDDDAHAAVQPRVITIDPMKRVPRSSYIMEEVERTSGLVDKAVVSVLVKKGLTAAVKAGTVDGEAALGGPPSEEPTDDELRAIIANLTLAEADAVVAAAVEMGP
jgi:hypothetical protein